MRSLRKWAQGAGFVGMLAIYLVVVWLGLTEESRRSLVLAKFPTTPVDYVVINVKVTAFDPADGTLNERITLIPKGRYAIDRTTPAVDLKLLINSVSGKQSAVYPKGERITPVDFTTVVTGNLNHYPFDSYNADIDLLVTAAVPPAPHAARAPAEAPAPIAAPAPAAGPKAPASALSRVPFVSRKPVPAVHSEDAANAQTTALVIGASDLSKSETVPIKENFDASVTGVKFVGSVTEENSYKLVRTSIAMRRANNVILVSIMIMLVMFILAISIMTMGLRVMASSDSANLLPLSLCVSLIFGLPALRNTQPGVPGIGSLCDYVSFIWAEVIVSVSAIGLAWIWILRTVREQRAKDARGGG